MLFEILIIKGSRLPLGAHQLEVFSAALLSFKGQLKQCCRCCSVLVAVQLLRLPPLF